MCGLGSCSHRRGEASPYGHVVPTARQRRGEPGFWTVTSAVPVVGRRLQEPPGDAGGIAAGEPMPVSRDRWPVSQNGSW